ncbi:MAG: RES family NAD+ phosphorylase [Cyclobacteriaceae bacterium]|jgi:RES domain-containing protein|tara:strand:- start:29 stop:478 length:450 start_codon:yes stop_codon:yes gene_type:complete
MIVYRITKSKHAADMSGIGSALHPGRWNMRGTPVLYTGESKEIALLETLVHIPVLSSPKLDVLTIEIPDSIYEITVKELPSNWNQYPAPTILSEIGQSWIDDGSTLGLRVPSCIIETSHNIILNCGHPDYAKVKIIDHQNFRFDTRLRK